MRNAKRAASLGTLTVLLVLALALAAQAYSGNSTGMIGGTTGITMMGTATTVTTMMGTATTAANMMGTGTTVTTMMGTGTGSTTMGSGMMFSDTSGQWYADMATHMASAGYMYGYTDGRFGGMDQINRAQFAAVMARMLGVSPVGTSNFSDTHGLWADGAVAVMAKAGIIMGHPDGTFGPYDPITRAQMTAMMDRARSYLGLSSPAMPMTELYQHLGDVAGHWAVASIDHMYSLGVVQGDTAGSFHPDSHTNRAQAAAMLWRWQEAR